MAERVCPVWVGYLLASPLRRLFQSPEKILGPYVREGMTVLDVGCAMGFFSLPMARLVGANGRVVCVDFQERMLRALERRARRAGLLDRVVPRACAQDTLGLEDMAESADFALAMAVVHEVPAPGALFVEIYRALKTGARLLVAEPKGHVSPSAFEQTITQAEQAGLKMIKRPRVGHSHAALFAKERPL